MTTYPDLKLKNPTDQPIEFFCGGRLYIYQPGEIRIEDGFVAYHALNVTNTGLIQVIIDEPKEETNEPESAEPVEEVGAPVVEEKTKRAK